MDMRLMMISMISVSFRYRFCKIRLQLCDGSTIILTFLAVG